MTAAPTIKVIIPARWESARFPGKPLALINGVPMIERVYRRVSMAKLPQQVVVATDDQRIEDCVLAFGGRVVRTSKDHKSGTDRCLEAAEKDSGADVVINVQGDEPLLDPGIIDQLAGVFSEKKTQIATVVAPVRSSDELDNPDVVKVLLSKEGNALAFSRAAIPHVYGSRHRERLEKCRFYRHVGIYAYRMDVLRILCSLQRSRYEEAEHLEQWRFLENGFEIRTVLTDHEGIGVDRPEDIARVEARLTDPAGH